MDGARHGSGAETPWCAGSRGRAALQLCVIVLAGCQPYALRDRQSLVPQQIRYATFMPASQTTCDACENLARAENQFADGTRHEDQGEDCVDLYYRAAIDAWRHMECWPAPSADPGYQAAWRVYHESLDRMLITARRYGRLDPRGRLIVAAGGRRRVVPIAYYGFPFKPQEFCQLLRADDFQNGDIACRYRTSGLGVSLVAMRQACVEEPFYPRRQHFPVTAVLRPASSAGGSDAVLEFYNPRLYDSLRLGPTVVGLESDLTAPLACLLRDTPRKYTEGLLDPGDVDVKPKLFLMEPYQRGKIPVIFIHGLWSDPVTWVDAVNDLRAQGDIDRRYQVWCFRYPTGRGLLESAAELREKLLVARETFDPAHQDAALDRMVLVGHSMGGLVAELQVTYSSDILWRRAAKGPLESVRTSPAMRERLQRSFFFDPSPSVGRVVFIATPHRGSATSRRLVGRIASGLVRISAPEEAEYKELMIFNRDIFAEYLWKSWPTSLDLMEPSNPLLQGFACMPFSRCVRLHSIIGTGGISVIGEAGDGVVSVSSARQSGVCSELLVPVRHDQLHHDPRTVSELARILREHAREAALAKAG
jgi:pimeloyl-ACP methyl ester carboxylesterase